MRGVRIGDLGVAVVTSDGWHDPDGVAIGAVFLDDEEVES